MEFIIVTGMSGSGKSSALKFFEDIGFYCVDNMPPALLPKFAELCFSNNSDIDKVALGIDIRGGKLFEDLFTVLDELSKSEYEYKILFIDASDDILIKRYKETRRNHPLAKDGRLMDGINAERKLLENVKKLSTYVIDTSFLLNRELKEKLVDIFVDSEKFNSLMITIVSFGFKHGIPIDSDMVFDVRFLPNPFYIAELRDKTGNEKEIQDFVMNHAVAQEFLEKLENMVEFLIPNYIREGKNLLVISIGCTGGKHRSVTLANKLFEKLNSCGYSVTIKHNDLDKKK